MRSRLSHRKLRAIIEALTARTAGEIDLCDDPDSPGLEDYEAALMWALNEENRRQQPTRSLHSWN
jgi:hypothetical protein